MIPISHRHARRLMAVCALVLLNYGCTGFKPKVAPPTSIEQAPSARPSATPVNKKLPIAHYRDRRYYVHQVRWPNETLALIAQWYTGRRANWQALSRATPNLRHNRLRQGDVVFIPLDMLQTAKPMPEQYVRQQRAPAGVPAPAARSGEDASPPQPYGPRPYPKTPNP